MAVKAMKTRQFPITVQRGSVISKIYRTPIREQDFYTVSYWLDGKRKRSVHSTIAAAEAAAGNAAGTVNTGDARSLVLSTTERASYLRAVESLKPTGAPLDCCRLRRRLGEAQGAIPG